MPAGSAFFRALTPANCFPPAAMQKNVSFWLNLCYDISYDKRKDAAFTRLRRQELCYEK